MLSDHTIGVIGLITGIVGLPIGIYGIRLALQSNRKLRTAEQAKARLERKLTQYMASQEFHKLAADGIATARAVRAREWNAVADLAVKLSPALLQARGAWAHLLLPLENDKLDVAVSEVQKFVASLPLPATAELSNEQLQSMILQCQGLADLASELAGRLSVESMSESEEDK